MMSSGIVLSNSMGISIQELENPMNHPAMQWRGAPDQIMFVGLLPKDSYKP